MNMCEKLTEMISGLATPIDVKLQLIRIFQHMHHDVETAATVSRRFAVENVTFKWGQGSATDIRA